MKENKYDLLIVGGGLAGLSAAIQFAKDDRKVILFEKEFYPFHKVCGEYISNESLAFLESLGIPISEMNLPKIHRLRLSDPNGDCLEEELKMGGFGISRFRLDELLMQKAIELGVDIREGVEVKGWTFDEQQDFALEAEEKVYQGKLLVAAYGKRSKLDHWLQRPFMLKKEPYVAVKYHIRYPVNRTEIVLHNFKNGYCGMSAIEDDRVCLCYLAHADDLKKEGSIAELERNVLSKNPHLAHIFKHAEFLYEKPLVISRFSFKNKKQLINHAVFVGDAAGLIPPLSGNGMSMALHGSKLFYQTFSDYLDIRITRAEAEYNYQKLWKDQFALRIKIGSALQAMFGSERKTVYLLKTLRPFKFIRQKLLRLTHGKSY